MPVLGAALIIGALNAVIFKLFELAVNDGTDYVWHTLFKSDIHRWLVVPLAIVSSVGLSLLYRLLHKKRVTEPHLNPLDSEGETTPVKVTSLAHVAAIGIASLIAGASLGPEASLVMLSTGLAVWLTQKTKLTQAGQLLTLSSVGALLVAFCGSPIPVLMPLLLLQQKKRLTPRAALAVVLAGAAAFGTLWLMDHSTAGYGSIPARPHASMFDVLLALGVGVCASVLGWLLKRVVLILAQFTKRLDNSLHWAASGTIFGLVLGALYFVAGEPIQFSGSQGSVLLLHHAPAYGLWALLGLIAAKLLATAWSLASGYQGGMVFPSIFIGVAVALIAGNLSGSTNPCVLVGSVAGIFGALTGPAVAFIFMIAILPIKLAFAAAAGILGAAFGNKYLTKLTHAE